MLKSMNTFSLVFKCIQINHINQLNNKNIQNTNMVILGMFGAKFT